MWKQSAKSFAAYLEMIKVEHTVFALPFAFLGTFLAAYSMTGSWPAWSVIGWVLVAMTGARSAAFGINRIFDRHIDARNPRTAKRAIPAGLLSVRSVWVFTVISFLLMLLAAAQLNPLALKLSPVAVFLLVIYSLTKRFTWLCHVILGITIALAPLGGWLAVSGELPTAAWVLFVLVASWIAGFDILYATQDESFDRAERLHSIPSRFGTVRSLQIAKWFHLLTVVCMFGMISFVSLGWAYLAGAILCTIILIYEHAMLKPDDMSRLQVAFFTMNGLISTILFVSTLLDLGVRIG